MASATNGPCDRACLLTLADNYLAALGAGNVANAPLAGNVAFVENLRPTAPGEGLWDKITGSPTAYAISVPDVDLQQVGWLGAIPTEDGPVLLALRLKVDGHEIAEIEHLYTAPAQNRADNLTAIRPGFSTTISEADRLDHSQLLEIGAAYYEALDSNDGTLAAFAPDCQRKENGVITAGEGAMPPPNSEPGQPRTAPDCKGQINSQVFTYIERIENRRMIAADPETGLAMGFSQFRHSMENLPYDVILSDGSITERNRQNMPYDPFDMAAAHVFKIGPEGQIHEIEAVGVAAPFNSPSGWESTGSRS